jgi:hypothetical protein
MDDVMIILSGLWVAVELTYLYGDVLRIFSGDAKKMFAKQGELTQGMWLGMAILMVSPIVMVVMSLTLQFPLNGWVNIIVAIFWFGFNLVGLRSYPGLYDKFLLIVTMGFNVLTIWYAWNWI